MVNEREDRYDSEEGEYHFSDDQMNYDTDAEMTKEEERPVAAPSTLSKIGAMTSRRRVILAGIIFIVLMGIVYKMLAPSSVTTQAVVSELNTAGQAAPPKAASAAPPVNEAPKPVVQTQMPPPEKATIQPEQVPPPAVVQNQIPPPPAVVAPAPPAVPAVVETPQSVTTVITTAPPTEGAAPQKTEAEKLNALEQQNAAIMNLLQTEYAQKISDYETQNTKLRGKVDEISRKMNRIESNLNQITQLLQGEGKAEIIMPPSSTLRSNKVTYHVQAIIPGRAWLKSEAGDTVTVAEGDILRNVGKVTKIDPYDGIVEIDVGNKVITLSYGMSAD